MNLSNSELTKAFPVALRDDVLSVAAALPEPKHTSHTFTVQVGDETVQIPYRIYHDPELVSSSGVTQIQSEVLDCLFTRHHNGSVRQEHLKQILDCRHEWVPPFVVQLAGEYVVDIICLLRDNIHRLDPDIYRAFLTRNPGFYEITKQRVLSYWNCYYREQRREEYAGFRVLEFFDRICSGTSASRP